MTISLPRLLASFIAVIGTVLVMSATPAQAATDYNNSRLMDDTVFDRVNSLTEAQIQSFLVSKGPCLANYQDVDPNFNGTTWTFTGSVSAAHIIYKAGQQWGLNPQVILSTLQKEESLITGTSCDSWRYNSAMGYGCPDSGGCNAKYAGFTRQVLWGSWQLKFNKERAYGNTAWDGDDALTYVGYMTQGSRKRCGTCTTITYDGKATLDGQSTYLTNGTTASLYTYTPHLGQAFPGIFEGFFGPAVLPDLSWEPAGQYAYADANHTVGKGTTGLVPGDRVYVGVRATNTGNFTWTNTGANPVKLGTTGPRDRNSPFCDSWYNGCNRPAALKEASVAPGETGTFEFSMVVPNAPGSYNEHFSLVADGQGWFNDPGTNFAVSVVPAVYSWGFAGQYSYTDQTKTAGKSTLNMQPGDRAYVGFRAQNTGNVTWQRDGVNAVHVGMTHPRDRPSLFYDSSWLGTNRPAKMIEASVPPGGYATFEYWVNAPAQPGTYPEYFSLVAEQIAWLNDPSLNFYSSVITPNYSWQFVGQYSYTDQTKTAGKSTIGMHAGERAYVGFVAKNTGNVTWRNDGAYPVSVGMTRPRDRLSAFFDGIWLGQNRPARMKEASVAPGGLATFEYWVKAPSQTGVYPEYFSLLAEHYAWMNDPNLNFYSTVVP